MTISEWIKAMRDEGFYGDFTATDGEQSYRGSISKDGKISAIKVQSVKESKEKIKEIFNK